jgi:hypothetical protein
MKKKVLPQVLMSLILTFSTVSLSSCTGALSGLSAEDQKLQKSGVISGIIKDSKTSKPIEGAEVKIDDKSTKSGSDGFYSIDNLTLGSSSIRVSKDGYELSTANIVITTGKNSKDLLLEIKSKQVEVQPSVTASQSAPPIQNSSTNPQGSGPTVIVNNNNIVQVDPNINNNNSNITSPTPSIIITPTPTTTVIPTSTPMPTPNPTASPTISPSASPQILLNDKFDNNENWTVLNNYSISECPNLVIGTWNIINGEYQGSTEKNCDQADTFSKQNFDNFILEIDFKSIKEISYSGVYFRVQADNNGYLVEFVSRTELNLYELNPSNGGAFNLLKSSVVPQVNDGEKHTFKIEAKGNSIKCYFDDNLKISTFDSKFSSGRIGLRATNGSKVNFDNLIIKSN